MYKSTILFTTLAVIQALSLKNLTPINLFLPRDEELLKACAGNVAIDDLAKSKKLNDLKLDLEDGKGLKCIKNQDRFADQSFNSDFLNLIGSNSIFKVLPGKEKTNSILVIKDRNQPKSNGKYGIIEIDLNKYRNGNSGVGDNSDGRSRPGSKRGEPINNNKDKPSNAGSGPKDRSDLDPSKGSGKGPNHHSGSNYGNRPNKHYGEDYDYPSYGHSNEEYDWHTGRDYEEDSGRYGDKESDEYYNGRYNQESNEYDDEDDRDYYVPSYQFYGLE